MADPLTIAALVTRIYHAFDFLHERRGYKLEEIRIVTGGGSLVKNGEKIVIMDEAQLRALKRSGALGNEADRLHKNSILKIRDLRYTLAVRRYLRHDHEQLPEGRKGKMFWEEAKSIRQRGDDKVKAQMAWLWAPQLDTLQRLEHLVTEAIKLGWDPDVANDAPALTEEDEIAPPAADSLPPVKRRRSHAAADEHALPVA